MSSVGYSRDLQREAEAREGFWLEVAVKLVVFHTFYDCIDGLLSVESHVRILCFYLIDCLGRWNQ